MRPPPQQVPVLAITHWMSGWFNHCLILRSRVGQHTIDGIGIVAVGSNIATFINLATLRFNGVETIKIFRVFCKVAKIAKLFWSQGTWQPWNRAVSTSHGPGHRTCRYGSHPQRLSLARSSVRFEMPWASWASAISSLASRGPSARACRRKSLASSRVFCSGPRRRLRGPLHPRP